MGLSTARGFKPSIVSPAGNLEKLRQAVLYGADEVYFGGSSYNLRSQSGNLSMDDIGEAVALCSQAGVKSVFLLNSFVHETDITELRPYVKDMMGFPFDAVMVSDPGMLILCKEVNPDISVHLSTQASTLNHLAVNFWNSIGISRIVLGREVSINEIRAIRDNTDAELEVFVHGALCISYSGRCLLSRYLSGRDANQGSCSHPCRWRYALVEEKREGSNMDIIEHARGTEILSSKDLQLIGRLGEYIDAGVNAFKIEGRMKSLYYAANTTRIYRHARDILTNQGNAAAHLPFWLRELDLVSHRPYTDDLFNEFDNSGFTGMPYIKKVMFLGYRIQDEGAADDIYVKAFNPIYEGETIEAIFPIHEGTVLDGIFRVVEIKDDEKSVAMAQPGKIYRIRFDRDVGPNAIFRRQIKQIQGA